MKKLSLLVLSLSVVFFSACSSKRVYEPKDVLDDWPKQGSINDAVIDVSSNVALTVIERTPSVCEIELNPLYSISTVAISFTLINCIK